MDSNGIRIHIQSGIAILVGLFLTISEARAGIAECGGIRLEDVQSCEIRGSIRCEAGCEQLGVYEKACATKLHKVCRQDCTLSADVTCTDECTESCSEQCDRGVPITCIHNCFAECQGACDAKCEGSENPARCVASCEATCDGECDIQCAPVVDGDCYKHCVECCGGSCGAQANMDCQTTCQDQEFETCEYELKADCDASCSGQGALFCDGEYVLSSSEILPCARALSTRGIVEVDVGGSISVGRQESKAAVGCSIGPPSRERRLAFPIALGLMFGFRRLRRGATKTVAERRQS